MGSSGISISLSSLMCEEDGASFLTEHDQNTSIVSLYNPSFILDDEEKYIEYLFTQEMGFVSRTCPASSSNHECSNRFWLRSARLHAIDWIFNTQAEFGFKVHTAYLSMTYFDQFLSKRSIDESKPWAIQLLSVACLSLAAKMEEQNVPSLSEYPSEEYRFQSRVIKNMELMILSTLEWKMGSATPFPYLHYFVTKFCPGSRPETIITKATDYIVSMIKDINIMHQRPSTIASAAVLAAFDATLTRNAMDHMISAISSWGNIESEKIRNKVKAPSSNLFSAHSTSTRVVENPFDTSSGTKRKHPFENSKNCPRQKLHRP
ncbi:unnamed protein product [Lupinus luteus]|uniref:B-like cyclin n=1 Tax=Lupinus luteus TaxID=3873 RepID=A0AAV1WQL5_LUPLU